MSARIWDAPKNWNPHILQYYQIKIQKARVKAMN